MQTETTPPSTYTSQVLSKKIRLPTHLQAGLPLHVSSEPSNASLDSDKTTTHVQGTVKTEKGENGDITSKPQGQNDCNCSLGCCQYLEFLNPWGSKSK